MKRTPAVDAMVRKHEEKPRHAPEKLRKIIQVIAASEGIKLSPTLEAAIVGDFPPTWGSLIKRADAPGGVSVFEAAPSGAPLASRPQTILSLDIGAVTGWALVDAKTEKIIQHGQTKYVEPDDVLSGRTWPMCDAVVIEEPRGFRTKTGSGANTWSVVVNARRSERWHNWFMWARGLPTFWYSDNKPKAKRLAELKMLTGINGDWREHEADAAWNGLAWVRANKAKGAGR